MWLKLHWYFIFFFFCLCTHALSPLTCCVVHSPHGSPIFMSASQDSDKVLLIPNRSDSKPKCHLSCGFPLKEFSPTQPSQSYLGHCANKEHPLFNLGEAVSSILVQGYGMSDYPGTLPVERWGAPNWIISLLQSLTVTHYNKVGDWVATWEAAIALWHILLPHMSNLNADSYKIHFYTTNLLHQICFFA